MPLQSVTNEDIADLLEQIADHLEHQADNPYRIEAFRNGAKSVRASRTPLTEIVKNEGGEALKKVEGIGQGLATTVFEFIQTGRSSYLQQLQAKQIPEELFQRIPVPASVKNWPAELPCNFKSLPWRRLSKPRAMAGCNRFIAWAPSAPPP
jgi:DNA polymerase/3'-5' exonuclease PolX